MTLTFVRRTAAIAIILGSASLAACKSAKKDAPPGGTAPPDAAVVAVVVDAAPPAPDAAPPIDASVAAEAPLPKEFVEYDALMAAHMKLAAPARAVATCALVGMDHRAVLFAPAKVPRPAQVPEAEWEEASGAFTDTDYAIGEMCQDHDSKPDAGDDDEVLALLKERYDKLVALVRRP